MDIGYKSDEIFLLSIEEYEHYKNEILLMGRGSWIGE